MEVYREQLITDPTPDLIYVSQHSGPDAPGILDRHRVLEPYGPLELLQQKRLAARHHKTTYAYDFPAVFENALREIWNQRTVTGPPGLLPPTGEL